MSKIIIKKNLLNIKFPKIINYNNFYYIFSIKPHLNNNLTKYQIILYKCDLKFSNFNIVKTFNFEESVMIRHISYEKKQQIFCIT